LLDYVVLIAVVIPTKKKKKHIIGKETHNSIEYSNASILKKEKKYR
jgi:hypothetical protein